MRKDAKNKRKMILSILICAIIFSSVLVASAAEVAYYWTSSAGVIDSSGYTANWGICGAHPTSYRITNLSNTSFGCNSDYMRTNATGDLILEIFPKAYNSATPIQGKNATFYLGAERGSVGNATFRFDLGYASGGTFTSLGFVTWNVTKSTNGKYIIDMSSISGTVPASSYLALKVSVTTPSPTDMHGIYLGTNGGLTGSNSGRFYINEGALSNRAPTANDQSVITNQDTPVSINLTGSDPDGDPLAYIVVTNPAHGALSGTAPNLTYTPVSGYNGSDNFTFKVNDSKLDSNIANVSITVNATAHVNRAPTANDQSVITSQDSPVSINLTGSDPDGDPLAYIVVTNPAHGALSGTAPNLTYTPVSGYNGSDNFTFKVNDSKLDSNIANVSITVSGSGGGPDCVG